MPLPDPKLLQVKGAEQKVMNFSRPTASIFCQEKHFGAGFFLRDNEKKRLLKPLGVPKCVHNHFSRNFMLGNKNALFENLSFYYNYKKKDVFSIIPLTFFVDSCNS